MLQQYAINGGIMPMMDPRMMPPTFDPRMMQPMMMYNPAIISTPTSPMMSPQPFAGMISPSTSTNSFSPPSQSFQQHYRKDSVGSNNGAGDYRRSQKRLSTAGSLTNSVKSGSRYYVPSPTSTPTTRRTTRNY